MTDEQINNLERVCHAAIKLLRPPYNNGSYICCDKQEVQDWNNLREALMKAGYSWEEYT